MTRKEELLALADRVEALTGPDREVDALISLALGLAGDNIMADDRAKGWCVGGMGNPVESLGVTTYVDAAIVILPPRHFWSLTMRGENRGGYEACCQADGPLDWRYGVNPACALTAAALRAKSGSAGNVG